MRNLERFLAVTLILSPVVVRAQNSAELRDILNRLQNLEADNRVLKEQVKSLTEQLASARGGGGEPLQDEIAVQKSRVEEMSQSKVESSQKLPIRITGM